MGEDLCNYFKSAYPSNEQDFDDWHENECNKFISDFANAGYDKVTIGMAQKVLNLAFKYLYCCNGADKFNNHFLFCHITLDDYMLCWYTRKVDLPNQIKKWSTIKKYSLYKDIQIKTRRYFNTSHWSSTCNNVLEMEFNVFGDEAVVEALINLKGTICKYSNAKQQSSEIKNLFYEQLDSASSYTIVDFINLL